MALRLASRVILVFALLAPITLGAQTFLPKKATDKVPALLSIATHPTDYHPARLQYSIGGYRLDAQGETVKMTYTPTGLSVEMAVGEYTALESVEPWQSRSKDTFKTLYLTFGTNGEMTSFKPSKE